jgi:aminoglycoside phosphotransferase (APT) family kinase protein
MLNRELMPIDHYTKNWQYARAAAETAGLRIVEHGWEQHVIIDELNGLVYRYPRHAAAAAKLDDEVAVLHDVNEQQWTLALPVMREHTPIYTAYTYIPGEVLSPEIVHTLNQDDFDHIGKQIGRFLAQFHTLDFDIVEQKRTKHTTTLLEYYDRRIEQGKSTMFYEKATASLQQLNSINEKEATTNVVIHGDMHGPNIVIDPSTKNVAGVIDLSEMETGDPHQEFRKVFMTFPASLPSAIETYESSGGQSVNINKVILWAYVNEWSNACHFAGREDNPTYQRALSNLKRWRQL